MKICIIGCGAAGLAVLRVFSEKIDKHPFNVELFAFERTSSIGGVWNYDRDILKTFVSPMYEELKTNLPKEVMGFPDCPFPNDLYWSFIHHTDVLNYIIKYSKQFDLEKFIQFNSNITFVEPMVNMNETKWKVSITNTSTSLKEERMFDVVVVANGHFDKPLIPKIEGLNYFKGQIIHSKLYRVAEEFQDKRVFVLGARNSGMDIAMQLSNTTKKVYLAHNKERIQCKQLHDLIKETQGISKIDPNGLVCTLDGNKYEVDVIIFCTGYEISLDFLSESCQVSYDNTYIRPLYNHLISPYFPRSLFFIGYGYEIAPFTFFFMQSKVMRAILQSCAKSISLSTEVLLEDIAKEEATLEKNNIQMRHRHFFNTKQWPYYKWCESVAEEIMTAKVPRHLENMFNIVKKWRFENTDNYRKLRLETSDENRLGFIIKDGPQNDFYSIDFT